MKHVFRTVLPLIVFCAMTVLSPSARAACTSPTAPEGATEYFSTINEYKICSNTQWLPFDCEPAISWDELLRYFKFDETVLTTAYNSATGSSTMGTLTNFATPPTWASTGGYMQGALDFNYSAGVNTNDYVTIGSDGDIDNIATTGSDDITISAWIFPDSLGDNNNGQIIGKDNGTTNVPATGWILRLTNAVANGIEFSVDFTGGANIDLLRRSAANAITLGAWNHVVLTWDGSGTATNVHIYVNGTEVSYNTSTNGANTVSSDAAQNMIIGNNRAASLTRMFDGKIDELRLYARVLSAAEISTLYSKDCVTIASCATGGVFEYDSTPGVYKYCDGKNTIKLGCKVSATDYTTGLVNRWQLDETSGNAADSVGGVTGTAVNTPTFNTTGGRINGAALFSPQDNLDDNAKPHFNLGTGYDLPANPFSVSLWVKPGNYADYRTMFGKRLNGGNNRFQFDMNGTVGVVQFYPCMTDAYFTPPRGQWTHLVYVSSTTSQQMYANGKIIGSTSTSGCTLGTCASCNANIGDNGEVDSNGGGTGFDGDPYKGYMDDLRVYNVALTAAQVDQIYRYAGCDKYGSCSATNAINYSTSNNALEWCNGTDWIRIAPKFSSNLATGLIGHWKLDEGSGTTTADSSGNGNTGTLSGSPAPSWVAGKTGNALSFNDTTTWVKLPDNLNLLQNASAATISAWINLSGTANENEIFTFSNGISNTSSRLGLWSVSGTSTVTCGLRSADADALGGVTSPSLGTGVWTQVTCTVDYKTKAAILYINGIMVADTGGSNFTATSTSNTVSLKAAIGSEDDGSGFMMNGLIDECRLYNRALSEDEVRALYYYTGGT